MIKCSNTECSLYTKDGSRRLGGPYSFDEYGGEKGARAAAHKREGEVKHFSAMKKSLAKAADEFGVPAVLEYVIKTALADGGGTEEDIILKVAFRDILDLDGQEIEKAKKKRVRRVTIEDEDDDDDGDEKKKTPPRPEVEEEPSPEPAGEEGEEPVTEERGKGPMAQGAGEKEGGGKMAQEGGELPKGWTPESIAKYWESLGGSVESCVAKAPDSVKDKERFCTRLQAKVGATGDGVKEEKEEPAPPVGKSIDEVLDMLAGLMVEKAFKRVGAPGGTKYKGEAGWDDPRSWLKAGTPDEIRDKAWKAMGGTVTGCMAKMKGKVDDPGAFCASLKDRVTGTTMWRGKKGKEEERVIGKSALEALDELLFGEEEGINWDDWGSIEKALPEWGATIVVEKAEDAEDGGDEEEEEGAKSTFLDVVRKSHERKIGSIVGGLVAGLREDLEVDDG